MIARTASQPKQVFRVEIIKPSHYDDDGYVIQWARSFVPSSSLACVTAIAEDAAQRKVLGDDVEIVITPVDELHTIVKPAQIIKRMQADGGRGLIMLTGVQSNQFPRAADMAAVFREAGLDVAIGGFHVSGCISMLPQLPPEIQAVRDLGVTLFAGEAETRLDQLFQDAFHGRLQPVYNFLLDLPDLENQVAPFLPFNVTKRNFNFTAFDAGRGCPFPADTPETIERDIKILQREVAVDIVEFFIMTPLPGSADHQQLAAQGVPMDPDMNRYDTEHVTTAHPKMSAETWQKIYEKAWHLYYSPEHVETMLRRAEVSGGSSQKLVDAIALYYGSQRFEKMHPLQSGLLRRKVRTTRRSTFALENPLIFYPKFMWETVVKYAGYAKYYWQLQRLRRKIRREAGYKQYTDLALTPVVSDEQEAAAACCNDGHRHDHNLDGPAVVSLTGPAPKAKLTAVSQQAA